MIRTVAQGSLGVLLGILATAGMVSAGRAVDLAPAADTGAPSSPSETPKPPDQSAPLASARQDLETVAPDAALVILGKKARDASGHDMGPVVDILFSNDGTPRAAVIDFGGFLGVGSRKIAIDWTLLQFKPGDKDAPVVLALDRATVQAAPEYKPSGQKPVQVVGPPRPQSGAAPTPGK